MSKMREERKIKITMSPNELRRLADKMEEVYLKGMWGDSTFVDFLGYSSDMQVCLYIDQEWEGWEEIKQRDAIKRRQAEASRTGNKPAIKPLS